MLLKVSILGLLTPVIARSDPDQPWVQQEPDVPIHNPLTSFWEKVEAKPPSDHDVKLLVAVRIDDERREALERVFWEVSDPDNRNYGKHLTMAEITELLAVPEDRSERVRSYFLSAGATEAVAAANRDMIRVTMPVSAAEAAMNTTINFFTHKEHLDKKILRASSGYSLPAHISTDVDMVGELLQFPRLRPKSLENLSARNVWSWKNSCNTVACDGLVTPSVLAERYKLPTKLDSSALAKNNSMAVAEFQAHYVKRDLDAFGTGCHRNITVDKNVGGNKPKPSAEAELDIEYIKSVASDVPLTVVYDEQYSLLAWANQIMNMSDAPLVHSVSYGNDEKQQSSVKYMQTCNTAFMKAGARGLSVLFASGDQGVCGREGCGHLFWFRFRPDFPAGSPYITAVGGTNFEGDSIGAESAWNNGGGGFSDTFPIPAYQQESVAAYKISPDAKLPPQKYWNATGRGYPDVAALGGMKNPYCIASWSYAYPGAPERPKFLGVAGTSASCPVVAGVFARLNGLRLAAGKPPLGFLNPFIYKNPSGFNDVTSGVNNAGREWGFTAVKGWDAATGMGTPNYEALSSLVMAAGGDELTMAAIVV